jgi:TonB family protein
MKYARCTVGFLITAVCFLLSAQVTEEPEILLEIESSAPVDTGVSPAVEVDSSFVEMSKDTVDGLEREPVLKTFVRAVYPQNLLRDAITGVVILDLLVSDSGRVDSLHIVKGVHPDLDSAVAAAVRQFVFTPAIAGGEPVPVILTYQYEVTLDIVMDKVEEYVNFRGVVYERGTRALVRDAEVYVSFIDTLQDTAIALPFLCTSIKSEVSVDRGSSRGA